MSVATRSQKMAQEAFACVQNRGAVTEEYRSFAREFPTLVHQCGLAQAVAFVRAKAPKSDAHRDYGDDLAAVLKKAGHDDTTTAEALATRSREPGVSGYIRLSRDALDAAVWIKRYVEALFEEKAEPASKQEGGK